MKARLKKALALAWANRHGIVTSVIAAYTALHRAGVL
jgi:hypothetical protein